MPGRFFLGRPVAGISDPPRMNIAPGQEVIVLTARGAQSMRWGMIPVGRVNARGRPVMETIVNARSETVFDKSAFADVKRAVVPVDGWYEWTGEKKRKQPWRISRKDGKLLYHRIEVGQNRISVLDTKSGNPIYDFLVDRSGAWWILGRKNVWIYAPYRVETGVKVIDSINHEKGAIWEMRVLRNVVHILSAKAGMSQLWNWELEQPSEVVPLLETPLSMFAKHFFYDDTSLIFAGREGIIYDVTIG